MWDLPREKKREQKVKSEVEKLDNVLLGKDGGSIANMCAISLISSVNKVKKPKLARCLTLDNQANFKQPRQSGYGSL